VKGLVAIYHHSIHHYFLSRKVSQAPHRYSMLGLVHGPDGGQA